MYKLCMGGSRPGKRGAQFPNRTRGRGGQHVYYANVQMCVYVSVRACIYMNYGRICITI